MPFAWFVALRYLREGRMQTLLILGAVSVGVGVLVFLTALMTGLQANLLEKTLGSQAHIRVLPPEEEARSVAPQGAGELTITRTEKPSQHPQAILGWQPVLTDVLQVDGVVAASAIATGSAFVVRGATSKPVSLRGVDPAGYDAIVPLSGKLREGRFSLIGSEALIGTQLAKDLGIGVGDRLRAVTASNAAEVYTVSGIFDLGSKDVNERIVFVSLRSAQTLFDLGAGVSSIEVKVSEAFSAEPISLRLAARTGLIAESWTVTNPQLLVALQSQDGSTRVIQFFITITVALGIASVLIVSVVQKSREIGVMRAVGAQASRVLSVFLIQGGLVGFVGAIFGSALGAGLARLFVTLFRGADGAPMFPIALDVQLFAGPIALATVVGVLAAVAPARRAARLDPAEVIRYG
jgi:lipoprotein-releasing system permease protein